MIIRKIQAKDNKAIEAIIKGVFHEFKLPLEGTAYEDKETPNMYASYNGEREVYYVIEEHGEVYGGGGIKQLKGQSSTICELQKMYFDPKIRGKGYGKQLFDACLETAKKFGYKQCYLESATTLKAAIHIYETKGFQHLEGPLGNTGHYSCGVWMIKDL